MKQMLGMALLLGAILLQGVAAVTAQEASAHVPVAGAAMEAAIRPGDQVAVRIFREPELSGTFTVSEGGEVVLPRLGRLEVASLSAQALQDSLQVAYARYLRNPAIEVTVLRRIAVHGEVRRPDLYMADLTMTVRDLIARAGGVTEMGNPNRVAIIRNGQRIALGAGQSATVVAAELHSGDQLVVGRRSWMSINALGIVSTAAVAVSVFVPLIRSLLD